MLPPHGQVQCLIQLSGRKEKGSWRWLTAALSLLRGEVTAWPERRFCCLDSPGTWSFGSESTSLATHPQLEGKRKNQKAIYIQCIWPYQISEQGRGKWWFFPWKQTQWSTRDMAWPCTVTVQHSEVKDPSNRLWDLEFSRGDRNLQIHEDNNPALNQGILIHHKR